MGEQEELPVFVADATASQAPGRMVYVRLVGLPGPRRLRLTARVAGTNTEARWTYKTVGGAARRWRKETGQRLADDHRALAAGHLQGAQVVRAALIDAEEWGPRTKAVLEWDPGAARFRVCGSLDRQTGRYGEVHTFSSVRGALRRWELMTGREPSPETRELAQRLKAQTK